MFGFEWNEKEERETLIKIGEERGKCQLDIYIVYTFFAVVLGDNDIYMVYK